MALRSVLFSLCAYGGAEFLGHPSMAMVIDGRQQNTISDAAARLRVSVKTVGSWIDQGILPQPPEVPYGTKMVRVFPEEYLAEAARRINDVRAARRKRRDSGPI